MSMREELLQSVHACPSGGERHHLCPLREYCSDGKARAYSRIISLTEKQVIDLYQTHKLCYEVFTHLGRNAEEPPESGPC